jgi:hypothetical protein
MQDSLKIIHVLVLPSWLKKTIALR